MKVTQKIPKFQRVLVPGSSLPSIDELKRIVRERDTLEKDLGPDGVWVSHADLKEFMDCLFALIWLEEPRGEIFQRKAERLIEKYQQS